MLWYIIFGVVAAAVILLCVWQNSIFVTKDYEVKSDSLPNEFDGFKIALISDLHKKQFGKNNCRLISAVRAAAPDIIAFPGDLISRFETGLKTQKELIDELSEIADIYYTFGNHEADADEQMREGIKRLNMTCLINSVTDIKRGNAGISVGGVCFGSEYYRAKNGSYRGLPRPKREDIARLIGEKPEKFTVLLAHNPDYLNVYSAWGAELVLSGHVHGGVIRIGGRGLLHPERRLFPEYTAGLYKRGKTTMALTAGLGKFRLFNPSEVMTVKLIRCGKTDCPEN